MKIFMSAKEIIVNAMFMVVYFYQLVQMGYLEVGDCYANQSMIPKYDYPEKVQAKGLDFTFMKYDPVKDPENGYVNMSTRAEIFLGIEIFFCATGVAMNLAILKFNMKKGIGLILRKWYRGSIVFRLMNLFLLTQILVSPRFQTCLCKQREYFYKKCSFINEANTQYTCFPKLDK